MRKFDQKIASLLIVLVFLAASSALAYKYIFKNVSSLQKQITVNSPTSSPLPEIDEAIQEKIAQAPPKHQEKQTVKTTTSGSVKTTIVADGDLSQEELNKIASATPSGNSPYDVKFSDLTGRYPTLEKTLKDYLNNNLKWGNEISALYEIYVKDAGDTGWSGQYIGSYKQSADGDIISASGGIILNSSYYKNLPASDFNNYMRLILSHEYGHHYTLYHKWVDMDLAVGVRFPDVYYIDRPLSKTATTTDCSSSWTTCEPEIIAEDYSYLYSGFGLHQMHDIFGYPSTKTKTWLDGLAGISSSNHIAPTPTPTPVSAPINQPPVINITAPQDGASLNNTINFRVDASDDQGPITVGFYVDNNLIIADQAAPYEISINTKNYPNGSHVLKAVAYDPDQSSEDVITVTFANDVSDNINPTVTFKEPTNPYSWDASTANLIIKIRSSDNVGVVKIKVYINDQFQGELDYSSVNLTWSYNPTNPPPGQYIVKAEAYDAAGNKGSATLTINKN